MPDETLPDDVPAGGRLDRTTMRTLGRRAATHPLVDSWAFEPDAISLDSTAYPDAGHSA
ncbi:hypothetical protein [Halorubrum sp. SD690R]|uniref:hypothetical protein n=1 Tax=Halorubrum sp. SD690R TaxID=2518117 RepID=UPI0013054341|nr:hypothetical protein [Halorubrum sp. SD690R]